KDRLPPGRVAKQPAQDRRGEVERQVPDDRGRGEAVLQRVGAEHLHVGQSAAGAADVAGVYIDRRQGSAQFREPAGEQPGSGADLEDRAGGAGGEGTEVREGGAVGEQILATFVWSARESGGHSALQVEGK